MITMPGGGGGGDFISTPSEKKEKKNNYKHRGRCVYEMWRCGNMYSEAFVVRVFF